MNNLARLTPTPQRRNARPANVTITAQGGDYVVLRQDLLRKYSEQRGFDMHEGVQIPRTTHDDVQRIMIAFNNEFQRLKEVGEDRFSEMEDKHKRAHAEWLAVMGTVSDFARTSGNSRADAFTDNNWFWSDGLARAAVYLQSRQSPPKSGLSLYLESVGDVLVEYKDTAGDAANAVGSAIVDAGQGVSRTVKIVVGGLAFALASAPLAYAYSKRRQQRQLKA